MHPFNYHRPTSFEDALAWLTKSDLVVIPVAGATDIIPRVRDGLSRPDVLLDIKALPGVRDLKATASSSACGDLPGQCLCVGAAIRMNELARSELVRSRWEVLAMAAAAVGNEQIRNRATIGGNICTASPAADSAPALFVLEARVVIKGPTGDRTLPVADFFTGPKQNALRPGELVVGLAIPQVPDGAVGHFEKLSRRKAGDLSIVSVAAMAVPTGSGYVWRLALGAVAPTPLRAPESEAILAESLSDEAIDRAAAAAYRCCCPIEDIRAGQEYRQAMVINLSRLAVRALIAKLPAS